MTAKPETDQEIVGAMKHLQAELDAVIGIRDAAKHEARRLQRVRTRLQKALATLRAES